MSLSEKYKVVIWSVIPNFGDALGPYIVSHLSGMPVKEKGATQGLKHTLLSIGSRIKRFRKNPFTQPVNPFDKNLIFSVGSILGLSNKESIIWGSGFIGREDSIDSAKKILAVRGQFTNNRLLELGFPTTTVFGDPALLLPLIYTPRDNDKRDVGIIPHYTDYDDFRKQLGYDSRLVNLRTSCVESVLSEITSCRYTLSSSLHGIIVSHAFGIPSIWIKNKYLTGGNFKFYDYFSSVGIPLYDGFDMSEIDFSSNESIIDLINHHKEISLPSKRISEVCKQLLEVAPFYVKPEFLEKHTLVEG